MSELFPESRRTTVGQTEITYKKATTILTKATGFMGTYDYTLNPYSGCSFGCTYCYAAFFTRSENQRNNWGYWLEVKENAVLLLKKRRKKPLNGKTIYMSSVTDPYQPIEKDLMLTRAILNELIEYHQPRLVIQTRSPLVTRDIDLLKKFKVVQVNMTITTDSENVRKVFEPLCPSNTLRMKAIREVSDAGINTCITMTPLLPIEDVELFIQQLENTHVKKFIVQNFHSEKGKFIAGTREKAIQLIQQMGWNDSKYNQVELALRSHFPGMGIGKEGFKPI